MAKHIRSLEQIGNPKTGNNIINWRKLNNLLEKIDTDSPLSKSDSKTMSGDLGFYKFMVKFFSTLSNYKITKNELALQQSFSELIEEWPIYLYFQNINKSKIDIKKFLACSDIFFEVIDKKYLSKFINEYFELKATKSFKDINNLIQLIVNTNNVAIEGFTDIGLIIKIVELNNQVKKVVEPIKVALYYNILVKNYQYKKVNSDIIKEQIYEAIDLLDKGLGYLKQADLSNNSDIILVKAYIESYLNINQSLKINCHYKGMICGAQVQMLMSMLPQNEDKELLNLEVKYKYLNRYNIDRFKKIDPTKISFQFKYLYDLTALTIKYANAKNIEKDIFNNDLQNFLKAFKFLDISNISDYVIDQIILLKLNNNNLENILLLVEQLSNEYFLSDVNFLSKNDRSKQSYINELENIIKNYGSDLSDIKNICQFIKKSYSLEQIKNYFANINNVTRQEVQKDSKQISSLSVINESERIQEPNKPNKVKTKGIADPSKTEKEEIIENKKHKASWIIDGKIITASDQEVIETESENYYVYIDSNLNIGEKQLNQFKNAAKKGFIAPNSFSKNGIKNIDKKIIELKINAGDRLISKTIYINQHGQKIILFCNPPIKHNQAEKEIKNAKAKNEFIQKMYVYSNDQFEEDLTGDSSLDHQHLAPDTYIDDNSNNNNQSQLSQFELGGETQQYDEL